MVVAGIPGILRAIWTAYWTSGQAGKWHGNHQSPKRPNHRTPPETTVRHRKALGSEGLPIGGAWYPVVRGTVGGQSGFRWKYRIEQHEERLRGRLGILNGATNGRWESWRWRTS
jgi:hypothetical protein